ncbi:MAG: hypothetical protein M3Y59_07585 [Myxococcota bacterium]|nr:hypothetical protein [Myxococcota bacterium]
MGGNAKWWLGLGAAALTLMIASGFAVLRKRARPSAPATVVDAGAPVVPAAAAPTVARDGCGLPRELSLSAAQDGAPVLLWAVAPVRLFLDDKPAFSSPEKPLRLSGEHTLRAEAKGEQSVITRFRVVPGTPALFHAQIDEGLGITLVRLGMSCTSCVFKDADLDLTYQPSEEPTFSLLQSAASTLRTDQWRLALARLRRVPPKDRTKVPYLRLASNLYQATADPDQALALARSIPPGRSNDLSTLLDALARLRSAEDRTTPEGLFARWNTVTDRFGALASRFAEQAPGPVAASTRRLEQLGAAFESQTREPRAQRATVDAAEETVLQLVRELRALKPTDCVFQAQVVGTATG